MITPKQFETKPILRVAGRFLNWLPAWITGLLLLIAVLNFGSTFLAEMPAPFAQVMDVLSNFSSVFLGIFIEAAPFLLLGTIASGFVEVFVKREDLARWIPQNRFFGALAGSTIGLFFPVCECGVVPFTRRLIYKGLPVPVGIATLLAAPIINPIVIASTFAAFGPGLILWARLGLTLVIATLTGLIFSFHSHPSALLRTEEGLPTPVLIPISGRTTAELAPPKIPLKKRMSQVFLVAADEFFEMGRYLVLGALLAALMQTFVRQSVLLEVGQGPVLSVLVMTGLGVLLSICSTVDAFIALAFAGTFTSGSILAFLIYGPMVDIKSIFMYLHVFKTRTVIYLVLLPFMLTLIFTVFINYFMQGW